MGRRSARLDEGCFVVEGATLVGEAVDAGWAIDAQFVAPGGHAVADAPGLVYRLADGVIERVASTQNPQPLIAIVAIPDRKLASLERPTFVVVADRIADPGNAGTIMRSAEAAGADALVLTPGSVDLYNPKVVRAAAGALFHLPVFVASLAEVRSLGLQVVATSSHQGASYTDVDLTGPVAVVVGNEAHGVADDAPVDSWLTIPHAGRSESLNVAMATTVLCFEVARQRSAR